MGFDENDQLDPEQAYLGYLRAEIERLTALLRAVESRGEGLAVDSEVAPAFLERPSVDTAVRPDSFFGMTTPQATRRFLDMMGRGHPQTPLAIVEALVRGGLYKPDEREAAVKNVYTALTRGKDKEFAKIQKEWGLSEWYPDRKLPDEKPSPRKRKSKKKSRKRKSKAKKARATPATEDKSATAQQPHRLAEFNEFVRQKIAVGKSRAEAIDEWKVWKTTKGA